MSECPFDDDKFVELGCIAYWLGISSIALNREAKAGKIPFVVVGKKRLGQMSKIRKVYEDRAALSLTSITPDPKNPA